MELVVTTFSQIPPSKHSPAGSRGGVQLVFVPAWTTFSSFMVHLQFMLSDCILGSVRCLVVDAAWCWVLPRPHALPSWLSSWLLAAAGRWLLLAATDGRYAPGGDWTAGFPCQYLFLSLSSVSVSLSFWCFWYLLQTGPS